MTNLTVTNCIISSRWAAFRIGPLSKGDFTDIVVTGCVFRDCGGGGIKIGMFEGAAIRNAVFSSLVMDRVTAPILVMNARWTAIGSRETDPPLMPPGEIEGLTFSDMIIRAHTGPVPPWDRDAGDDTGITGDDASRPDRNAAVFLHGHRDGRIGGFAFRNIRLEMPGGGKRIREADEVPDMHDIDIREGGYWTDDKTTWGPPPASAFYARHLDDLRLRDITVTHRAPDGRPVAAFVDCRSVRADDMAADGRDVAEADVTVVRSDAIIRGTPC